MIVPMLGDDVPRETIEQVGGTAGHRLRQQPQHPCAIADDAFGAYAFLAQHAQIEGTIALGQTLAGKVVDQRQMRELRYWCGCGRCGGRCLRRRDAFQRAANPQLDRRRPQQIAPTHNLGDAHIEIIDTDDELIREQPVRTPDDYITNLPPHIDALRPEHLIVENDRAHEIGSPRHRNTPGMTVTAVDTGVALGGRQATARSG